MAESKKRKLIQGDPETIFDRIPKAALDYAKCLDSQSKMLVQSDITTKDKGGLVLQRMAGETIHIGRDIEVKVVSIKGDRVSLRIVAPLSVPIARSELMQSSKPKTGRRITGIMFDEFANHPNEGGRQQRVEIDPGIGRQVERPTLLGGRGRG